MSRSVGGSVGGGSLGRDSSIISGEVLDVVLSPDHDFGTGKDHIKLGWVKIKLLGTESNLEASEDDGYWIAPLDVHYTTLPLIGEHVICVEGSSIASQLNPRNKTHYWLSTINLGNDSNSNLLPNASYFSDYGLNDVAGDTFEEKETKHIQYIEGDTILQSRWNSSIRLSSTAIGSKPDNTWSIGSSNGDPITILTNGYEENSDDAYMSDVNKDDSTIIMTSTQKIELEPANDIAPQSVAIPSGPVTPQEPINAYVGKSQVIINSDKLIFNAKADNIILSAKKDISLSTSKWKLNVTALADILLETLNQLKVESHPTPCGPSGPPLQAPVYTMLITQLEAMKQ